MMQARTRTRALRGLAACLLSTLALAVQADERPEPYAFCDAWLTEGAKIDPGFLDLIPGKDQSLLEVGELSKLTKVPDERALLLLQRFVKLLQARGTRLVLVVPPPRGLMTSELVLDEFKRYETVSNEDRRRAYEAALAALARSGAIVPDVLAAADEYGLDKPSRFYRRMDIHWSPEGSEIAARAVAAAVEKSIDLSQLPRRQYVTRAVPPEAAVDRVVSAIERVCKKKLPREFTKAYVTEAREAEPDSGGLLGDSVQPVVLAGTSFSRSDRSSYNFGGFLQQYLSMDVLNVAIPGGGLATSLISYLGSMDFREAPPSILIWEVRTHDLPDEQMMQRAIATAQGECEGQGAVLTTASDLRRGSTTLLTLTPAQRKAMDQPLYLDIGVGETGLNKFRLRLEYSDFTREDVSVDLSRATVAARHYYYALEPERLRKLESVSLRPAARLHGPVSVAFCPLKASGA